MRLALLVLLAAVASGSSYASTTRTEVVRWSPFHKTLAVNHIRRVGGCGDYGPGSEAIGDFGYRCGYGNLIADPCWRDGPGRTNFILCAGSPWDRTVDRIRVPHFMLRDGVTFGKAPTYPWSIELTDGDRCTAYQGAHATLNGEGGPVVDYSCKSGIVLLRTLRRSRPFWTIGSARFDRKLGHYRRLADVTVRRVFLGGLPPAMLRQTQVAHAAAVAAINFVRPLATRPLVHPHLYASRVRLALPAADWANVQVWGYGPKDRFGRWNAIVHRVRGRWTRVAVTKDGPFCLKLPAQIQQQLFEAKAC